MASGNKHHDSLSLQNIQGAGIPREVKHALLAQQMPWYQKRCALRLPRKVSYNPLISKHLCRIAEKEIFDLQTKRSAWDLDTGSSVHSAPLVRSPAVKISPRLIPIRICPLSLSQCAAWTRIQEGMSAVAGAGPLPTVL
jgi:hypothetical protein